eukprot:TRINITY_DN4344_c0_g1_i7.p2 TRINITY_DN4344_c0_g1~~TRINITY_DN4344_c0_g1_i7.p2  ORF type:complete len:259 (-),score=-17.04 TRINITY_DN4344_c0_g1_i7:244-1020(-)
MELENSINICIYNVKRITLYNELSIQKPVQEQTNFYLQSSKFSLPYFLITWASQLISSAYYILMELGKILGLQFVTYLNNQIYNNKLNRNKFVCPNKMFVYALYLIVVFVVCINSTMYKFRFVKDFGLTQYAQSVFLGIVGIAQIRIYTYIFQSNKTALIFTYILDAILAELLTLVAYEKFLGDRSKINLLLGNKNSRLIVFRKTSVARLSWVLVLNFQIHIVYYYYVVQQQQQQQQQQDTGLLLVDFRRLILNIQNQ